MTISLMSTKFGETAKQAKDNQYYAGTVCHAVLAIGFVSYELQLGERTPQGSLDFLLTMYSELVDALQFLNIETGYYSDDMEYAMEKLTNARIISTLNPDKITPEAIAELSTYKVPFRATPL